jgi:hypothetical protein
MSNNSFLSLFLQPVGLGYFLKQFNKKQFHLNFLHDTLLHLRILTPCCPVAQDLAEAISAAMTWVAVTAAVAA